jgi:hypothetical protein
MNEVARLDRLLCAMHAPMYLEIRTRQKRQKASIFIAVNVGGLCCKARTVFGGQHSMLTRVRGARTAACIKGSIFGESFRTPMSMHVS